SGGDEGPKGRPHIIFWGSALGLVVGALLIIGGLGAIQTAMVIGALPFGMVMALMGIALIKAIYKDSIREKAGVEIIYDQARMQTPKLKRQTRFDPKKRYGINTARTC
ncbi:MAG: BCCT family transporter, partial [Paracoccaceae bacterium]|nr:BCCT family transporter [Paracoccaceae bacterium]